MEDRTVTGAIETDAEPEAIMGILQDVQMLPEWAPLFADRVEPAGENRWRVTRNGEQFAMEVAIGWTRCTVDYLREIAPGQRGGAYLRVLPRPGGGSVVVMTLPVAPGRNASEVGAILQQELAALIRLHVA